MAPVGGPCGLLWIGAQFYKTTDEFNREAAALGVSRRIAAIPRGFKVGQTWVMFAHPKAVETFEPLREPDGALDLDGGTTRKFTPGIFKVWRPVRIEKILPESARGSAEVAELEEKGITPVFVPDDDPDHRGSVYDDEGAPLEDTGDRVQ